MAERSGFFNEKEYTQDDLMAYYKNSFMSGIRVEEDGTMSYKVTAGSGNVSVAPGYANVCGIFNELTTAKTLTVPKPTNYMRIDRVVVRLDNSAMNCLVVLKQGTEASSPQPPALQRDGVRYELSLAQLKVGLTGAITVLDERPYKALCGGMGPRNPTEMNTWFQNFQEVVEKWFRTQQGTGWRQIFEIDEGEIFPDEAEAGALCRVYKTK